MRRLQCLVSHALSYHQSSLRATTNLTSTCRATTNLTITCHATPNLCAVIITFSRLIAECAPGLYRSSGIGTHFSHLSGCRVVLSEAVDGYICFTRNIQHGGD